MKIATFNVNGINGRLAVLLRWLSESKPDVVCLQEIKASDHSPAWIEISDRANSRAGKQRRKAP